MLLFSDIRSWTFNKKTIFCYDVYCYCDSIDLNWIASISQFTMIGMRQLSKNSTDCRKHVVL